MSKFNKTPAKILSRKNIKGSQRPLGFNGSTTATSNNGVVAESKEIIEADLIENSNNLDLNGSQTIDSVATTTGDIVVANAQSTASEVDIYVVDNSGDWVKVDNIISNIELIRIKKGSNANKLYSVKDGTSRDLENLEFELVVPPSQITTAEIKAGSQTELRSIAPSNLAELNKYYVGLSSIDSKDVSTLDSSTNQLDFSETKRWLLNMDGYIHNSFIDLTSIAEGETVSMELDNTSPNTTNYAVFLDASYYSNKGNFVLVPYGSKINVYITNNGSIVNFYFDDWQFDDGNYIQGLKMEPITLYEYRLQEAVDVGQFITGQGTLALVNAEASGVAIQSGVAGDRIIGLTNGIAVAKTFGPVTSNAVKVQVGEAVQSFAYDDIPALTRTNSSGYVLIKFR